MKRRGSQVERNERRALLIRIAKGEYAWPDLSAEHVSGLDVSPNGTASGAYERASETLTGERLSCSSGIRRVVDKLLVRDPRKRSKIVDLWEDEWMRGKGAPVPPITVSPSTHYVQSHNHDGVVNSPVQNESRPEAEAEPDDDACADNLDEDGLLVDEQEIGPGHVTRQEHY